MRSWIQSSWQKVYFDYNAVAGVQKGQVVDPSRILPSRFVLTNKGGAELSEATLKARWIFGGHKDPDAGKYATDSPTASLLGYNLMNFIAVQLGFVVEYEDVSAAFLQGEQLPDDREIYVRTPHGYPPEIVEYLQSVLGKGWRTDIVKSKKGGFGLPESPRLFYLMYRAVLISLTFKECKLLVGIFVLFHVEGPKKGKLRAMAGIHVDDTRVAGDETSQPVFDALRKKLTFGKNRKATDGWQKCVGRWEKQDPTTLEF